MTIVALFKRAPVIDTCGYHSNRRTRVNAPSSNLYSKITVRLRTAILRAEFHMAMPKILGQNACLNSFRTSLVHV